MCFIDTPGAYPGIGAEERGQAQVIAQNMFEMSRLESPVICVVIGEGGSGGALGIGVGDKVAMLEHAYYSVISPEGCAGILWKSHTYAEQAAQALKMTSKDLSRLKVIDDVIEEPLGGAHRDHHQMAGRLKLYLIKCLRELTAIPKDQLVAGRYEKFRRMGVFLEGASGEPAPEPEPAAAGANSVLRGPHRRRPRIRLAVPKPAGCLPGTGSQRSPGWPARWASPRRACPPFRKRCLGSSALGARNLNPRFAPADLPFSRGSIFGAGRRFSDPRAPNFSAGLPGRRLRSPGCRRVSEVVPAAPNATGAILAKTFFQTPRRNESSWAGRVHKRRRAGSGRSRIAGFPNLSPTSDNVSYVRFCLENGRGIRISHSDVLSPTPRFTAHPTGHRSWFAKPASRSPARAELRAGVRSSRR